MSESEPAPRELKRFYKRVETARQEDGFAILLDGKPLRTPARQALRLEKQALAEALAAEWYAQGEKIEPFTMPLTRLVGTAIDRVAPARAKVIDHLVEYAGTDLLCYRALYPSTLIERQHLVWQPILDWASFTFEAELLVVSGVAPIAQPPETLDRLRTAIQDYDDIRLTALADLVPALGSFLLGLAVAEERLSIAEAFAASQMDESWQEEQWGEDFEQTRRRERLHRDVMAAGRLLELSRESS